ncbi:GMC oxidoreductase [Zopfia rhizophila CBS 207.26]|uniref:GMC oxidoreductase n=1 Tax=Zopfia rhizophila CBS 207.26 TaxID=1314779 RepID=A0A6A6DM41_9PEZI|nr:GMC oxidoreductase [Zopfia rhizophila CBS 207.26]
MDSIYGTALLLWLSASLRIISAWPQPAIKAQIRQDSSQLSADEYDYVIVGGGTSGLTVGDRLTVDGKFTVLVLEYGYFDTSVGMNPRRMFNITSEPSPGLNNRTFRVGVGCVVGGSSTVNGQVFLRGSKLEYDAWKELSGPNSTIRYNTKYWSKDAKIYATFGGKPQPLMKNLFSAISKMPGMTVPEDSGAGEAGLYWYPISQDNVNFQRSSARTGHWEGLNRSNYEMIVGAKPNKINFDGDRAISVQYISRNDSSTPPVTIKARKHVILAAGSIHTPQDLPGVRSNFQDHSYIPNIAYSWGTTPNGIFVPRPWCSMMPPNLAAMIGMPVSYTKELIEGYKQQQHVYAKLFRKKNNLHPLSRGTILPDPDDIDKEMKVDYRASSNTLDTRVVIEIIKFMRRYMTQSDLKIYNATEMLPGAEMQSDEELMGWARGIIIPSVYHPAGTELGVHGVRGLSVVDASIMPTLVGATTSMTVYAIAEKAAGMIKAKTK